MNIIKFENQHIPQVVEIHQLELEVGVLNYFGNQFLKRMYSSLLKDNWGYVVISDDGETVVGFVFATKKNISLLKCLSLNSVIILLKNILFDFAKANTFFINFRKLYLGSNEFAFNLEGRRIELSQFAVKEGFKGMGLGSKLVESLEIQAKNEGFSLVFTRTNNIRLVKHYKKSRAAKLLLKVPLGTYESHLLEWSI